tara:strand:+ start:10126 stop:10386 length:261 start_codon:yes stop_codon:yes gene_type:complete
MLKYKKCPYCGNNITISNLYNKCESCNNKFIANSNLLKVMITYGLTSGVYSALFWNEVNNILLNGVVMSFLYALTYLYSIELFKED